MNFFIFLTRIKNLIRVKHDTVVLSSIDVLNVKNKPYTHKT